jgi:hypothetical protein
VYKIRFDFEAEDEPPRVYICDAGGSVVLEVFEEPVSLKGEWSWEEDDWKPGPFAEGVLNALHLSVEIIRL